MTHSKQKVKILIYCQDSLGLGHLRRTINVAHVISRLSPETTILFVSDSPLSPFFKLPPNSDVVKLPTIVKVGSGVWEAPNLPVSMKQLRKIRSQVLKSVAKAYQPDVMLVDHMPQGAMRELIPCLKTLRKHSPHTRIILGLRDILGASEDIIPQWKGDKAYEVIAKYYDSVLVYGNQDIYDLAYEYDFPLALQRKIFYTGYVFADGDDGVKISTKLSTEFSTYKPYNVLVTGGGGSDAFPFMNVVLDAVKSLGEDIPFNTYMITGPFMPFQDRHALMEKAEGLPVVIRRKQSDCYKLFPQVDLVASMAGYNTICEILGFGKRAVVIPRPGPSAEQGIRSGILDEKGYFHSIHPRDLTTEKMAQALMDGLNLHGRDGADGRQRHEKMPIFEMDGAKNAAEFVLKSVNVAPRLETVI